MNTGLTANPQKDLSSTLPLQVLEKALMYSPYGYVINDCSRPGNPIVFVNEAFTKITGYEQDDVYGKSNHIMLCDDTDQKPLVRLTSAVESGVQCTVTLRNYKKNGSLFYCELTVIETITHHDGENKYRLWCLRDVTELVVQEKESALIIAEKEARFLAYLQNSNEAIWRLDFDQPISLDLPELTQIEQVFTHGVFREANDISAKIYGYSKGEDIIGKKLSDFMSITDVDNAKKITDLVRSNYIVDNMVSFEKKPDGTSLVILNNIRPTARGRKILNIWGTSLEISELFRAQENLKESKEQLAAQQKALKEKNIALKVILSQVEEEKRELTDRVLANIDHVLLPSVERIKLNKGQDVFIEQHVIALKNLTSSFGKKINSSMVKLSPREMEVCSLVRNGMVNKEIAHMLKIAVHTVEKHRRVVRKKLGLANKGINLHTYLNSL